MKLFLTWLIIFYFRFINKFNLYKNNHSSNKIDLDIKYIIKLFSKVKFKIFIQLYLKKNIFNLVSYILFLI